MASKPCSAECVHKVKKLSISEPEMIQQFWTAPMDAYFSQKYIAPVAGCSEKTLESDRWRRSGIPFRKVGGRVLYQKRDVVGWIESHAKVSNTGQYGLEATS